MKSSKSHTPKACLKFSIYLEDNKFETLQLLHFLIFNRGWCFFQALCVSEDLCKLKNKKFYIIYDFYLVNVWNSFETSKWMGQILIIWKTHTSVPNQPNKSTVN